jgi:hypothetical protein
VRGISKLSSTGDSNALTEVAGINFEQSGVIIATMTDLLSSKNFILSKFALQFIGGILNTDNVKIFNLCILNGVIDKLTNLMYSADFVVVKQACWAISN